MNIIHHLLPLIHVFCLFSLCYLWLPVWLLSLCIHAVHVLFLSVTVIRNEQFATKWVLVHTQNCVCVCACLVNTAQFRCVCDEVLNWAASHWARFTCHKTYPLYWPGYPHTNTHQALSVMSPLNPLLTEQSPGLWLEQLGVYVCVHVDLSSCSLCGHFDWSLLSLN